MATTFSRFKHNSEPSAIRLIRTSSGVFGPRGDEKNSARQQWLAYLSLKNKSSKIINYRGNRFNNLFTGAVATLYRSEDTGMIDFISNYLDSPNDKNFYQFLLTLNVLMFSFMCLQLPWHQ